MHTKPAKPTEKEKPSKKSPRKGKRSWIPFKALFLSAIPVGLSVFYVTMVAPSLVPVPPGVKVPSEFATHYLGIAVSWCGENPLYVMIIGAGLLLPGLIFHLWGTAERYYLRLSIVVLLALGFTYLSISAPIDRLIHAVENAVPQDNRVPEHHNR